MTTTFAPSFSRTTVAVSSSSSSSSSSAVPSPLTVLVHSSFEGTSDFFPFHDLAKVGGYTKDDFTFRDLIQDGIDGGPQVDLYLSGCQVRKGGAPDCPTACNDTTLHFGSFETFYNCAALAAIAHWTGDIGTYYLGVEAERNASVLMGSGGTLAGFRARPVLESFAACAVESCTQDQLSAPCDASVMDLSRNSSSRDIFAAMDKFCPELRAEINPDIFGPGVLISYVLQVVFSASLYLFLKIFTFWVGYSQKPAQRRPTSERLVRRLTRIESMIWKDSSALSRTSIAIAATLVEFQEAQCWFVFAVQIASILAIVVNSQEGTFWGEIVVNSAVAFHVSQNGILPMFLVQICLHNEGIRNWHTFLGFCMEYLLAIVATTQRVSFRGSVDLFRGQHAVAACGGNPSPRTYCASSAGVDGLTLTFFPHPLVYKLVFLVLDTVAIAALAADQLAWTLRTHQRTRHWTLGAHGLGRWPDGRLKRHWVRWSGWFWHGLEFAYLVINVLYLVSLSKVISNDSFQANRWSYGQIIAMTVWGPVIVKLFSLILSGPPKNGEGLNAGPPRLRIDNVLNHRQADTADDVMSTSSSGRWIPPPPPQLPLQRKLATPQSPDIEGGMKEADVETAPPRTITIRHE
ncbi:hypothetical protein ISF_02178 [Cordyceps fumosorosea ARSEF 2679]|uniref:Uncharacterized protein n=1 Tax=Cordyceps fumosorosea (strain ARSEF 2679) TaxID=1081104 RepID=A0A168CPC9_CORFA|nr:hypothetical protein ISF_02178 [Cordyceps fumosorosea ARSEF 2679]OAA71627.1 hypothetical protein ISF_02178 [Cordyceps fumosorosea ARSEF 2679]